MSTQQFEHKASMQREHFMARWIMSTKACQEGKYLNLCALNVNNSSVSNTWFSLQSL